MALDLRLTGKRALVTGGSRGIGKAVARALLAEGASVMLAARGEAELSAAALDLTSPTCGSVHWSSFDATDDVSVDGLVANVIDVLGGLDIVVNAAATPASAAAKVDLAALDTASMLVDLNVKVLGYLRVARAAAPHMRANGWGRIVNIGGLAVRSTGSYAASIRNAAVVALTKCIADELGPQGIAVTVVHPGATRTERTAAIVKARAGHEGITLVEAEQALYGHSLNGRIADVEEVAAVVAFLASPLGAAINGDSIYAGGGSRKAIHY